MQKSDKILDICGSNGIEVQLISGRFRFKYCPFCGSEKWKIWLYESNKDGSIAGSCFRCGQKFTLCSLLEKYSLPPDALREICARKVIDTETEFHLSSLDNAPKIISEEYDGEWNNMPSWRYWDIAEKPNHPASQYAISRGVMPALYPEIKIDISINAVCFIVKDEAGKVIGFQSRYVSPKTEAKTYTAYGFKTATSLLRYYNTSDKIFICEGPFNAVSAHNWGHTALCTFGSKISSYQLQEIRKIAKETNKQICCAFDNDDPGVHAYLSVKDVCSGYGIEVLKVEPEFGNDLNDSWKKGLKYKEVTEDKSLYNYLPEL
jgi:hypothetical protein